MRYLLTAQTVLDLLDPSASNITAARRWADAVDTADMRLDAVSIAEARLSIETAGGANRSHLQRNLDKLIADIQADTDEECIDFGLAHAQMWATLRSDARLGGVGAMRLQPYAIAMVEGLTVVEEADVHTPALQAVGVTIQVIA